MLLNFALQKICLNGFIRCIGMFVAKSKLTGGLANCVDVASKAYQLLNKIMWKLLLYTVYLADVCDGIRMCVVQSV